MEPWRRLDNATVEEARALLATCCASGRWIERMLVRRPFAARETLFAAAREEWFALDTSDWLEAFAHHPEIGDLDSLRHRFANTRDLARGEQASVESASGAVLSALAEGNRAYQQRFGYIFIVCATGKRAEEMLALLELRLRNDLETEIKNAAEEQAKITEIRLMRID